jgi:ComEC/Rec2-like protein
MPMLSGRNESDKCNKHNYIRGCNYSLEKSYSYGQNYSHDKDYGYKKGCGDEKKRNYNRSLYIQLFLFLLLFLVGFITTYIHENYDNKIFSEELFSEELPAAEKAEYGGGVIRISGVVEKVSEGTYSKRLMLKKCCINGRRLVNNIVLEISDNTSYGWSARRGDYVEANVELEASQGMLPVPAAAANPGQFDLRQYYKSLGYLYYIEEPEVISVAGGKNRIVYRLDSLKTSLKAVYRKCCTATDAGVYAAMVTGDRSDMDSTISELFSAAGIGHILAISGLHISLIGMGLYKLLRRIGFLCPMSAIISGIFVVLFGVMTGNSVSATRAIVMFVCAVNAQVLGRRYDILSAVSLSAIILILKNPYVIANSGFLLSFMAIAGVAVVTDGFSVKWLKWLTGPAAIQLATFPIILWFYYEVPVYSVFLNLIVVPLMSLIMISALGCGMLGLISIPAGCFFAGAGHYILILFQYGSELMLSLPGSVFVAGRPELWQVMVYYILLFLFSQRKRVVVWIEKRAVRRYGEAECEAKKHREVGREAVKGGARKCAARKCEARKCEAEKPEAGKCVMGANIFLRSLLVIAIIILLSRGRSGLEVTFLDVGQGDAIFISLPNGGNVFIDGGSTSSKNIYEKVIEPFLKYKGVRRLDFLFLTHSDADHENGWAQALSGNAYIPDIYNLVLNGSDYSKYLELRERALKYGALEYGTVEYGALGGDTSEYGISGYGISKYTGALVWLNNAGADEINARMEGIVDIDDVEDIEDIEAIATALEDKDTEILCAEYGMEYVFGECSIVSLNEPGHSDANVNVDRKAYKTGFSKTGTGESENDNSIVLLLQYKGKSILFTGDMTSKMEADVAEAVRYCGVDSLSILKVGHHGSKYSSSEEFLASIMPQAAVISCAARNTYGHPHKETLQRMEDVGALVLRTDEGGAIIAKIRASGAEMQVYEYCGGK